MPRPTRPEICTAYPRSARAAILNALENLEQARRILAPLATTRPRRRAMVDARGRQQLVGFAYELSSMVDNLVGGLSMQERRREP